MNNNFEHPVLNCSGDDIYPSSGNVQISVERFEELIIKAKHYDMAVGFLLSHVDDSAYSMIDGLYYILFGEEHEFVKKTVKKEEPEDDAEG